MITRLSALISQSRPPEGPMVVGVTGMDTSGKSEMTTLLAQELETAGLSIQIVRLDDFHRTRSGEDGGSLPDPVQFFDSTYDFERLRNEILKPIRDEGQLEKTLICLDMLEETWSVERKFLVKSDTIVLLEGIFLFRPDIAHFLDLIIHLHVDEVLSSQSRYLEEYPAERNADVIIDNNDFENPIVIKWHEAT